MKPVQKYCYALCFSMFCITALFFASVNCLFSCRICQDIFWRLHERGYISQDTVDQLQCQNCDRLEHFQLSILLLICTGNVVVLDFHASSLINSLHAEMVCTLPFINAEINVIGLRSKWQALPRKPWAVPKGGFTIVQHLYRPLPAFYGINVSEKVWPRLITTQQTGLP